MIMINFVMMSENLHQLEHIVRLAAQLGVDQVNFKQCDVVRGEHGKGLSLFGPNETREIRRFQKALTAARRVAKKLSVRTTATSFTPTEKPACEQDPTDSAFIRYDGTVAPCISLANGGPTTFLGRDASCHPCTIACRTGLICGDASAPFFGKDFASDLRHEEAFHWAHQRSADTRKGSRGSQDAQVRKAYLPLSSRYLTGDLHQ
jgi:hypothetical protein